MKTLRVEATLTEDKTLILSDLPFRAGETVEVVIRNSVETKTVSGEQYPLRGKLARYEEPFETVAADEWVADAWSLRHLPEWSPSSLTLGR